MFAEGQSLDWRNVMKYQRLLVAMTVLNLLLLL
jgi:hypothetical protein